MSSFSFLCSLRRYAVVSASPMRLRPQLGLTKLLYLVPFHLNFLVECPLNICTVLSVEVPDVASLAGCSWTTGAIVACSAFFYSASFLSFASFFWSSSFFSFCFSLNSRSRVTLRECLAILRSLRLNSIDAVCDC